MTVKPLYGKQEGAVVGYNPHKPGRPSHTYHTYMIANLRLILEVEVQAATKVHLPIPRQAYGHYWIVCRARIGPLLFGAIVIGVATPS